ncbi:MAG TPA: Hsp20/alpha crystallin family protein [Opitutaceae bacterium]|jgi:HSP20 family protein|nr:Hsp20/alpha crystallin family protein [Opitutaceae bacterium]
MHIISYRYPNSRSLLSEWEDGVGRLVANAFTGLDTAGSYAGYVPVTLDEDKAAFYVRAELPGVARDAISLEFADGSLALTASRKQKAGDKEDTLALSRTVALPADVQADKATAVYENGVLTVTVPKREEAKPLKIAVG